MFVIGGVAALKQHPFFEDLDWTDLINLELDPPIDLSKPYVIPNSSGNNNNSNNNPQPPAASNAKKGDINSPALTSMNMNMNINNINGNKDKDRDIGRESDREGRSCLITPRTRPPYDTESLTTQTQTMTLPLTVEHLTRHFHEGFTGQQVSLSDVEESYSTSTLSRAGILSYLISSYLYILCTRSIYLLMPTTLSSASLYLSYLILIF